MWRKLYKPIMWLFGYELVLLRYSSSSEAQIRFAKVLPSGIYVKAIASYYLLPLDGSGGRSYVRDWYRL